MADKRIDTIVLPLLGTGKGGVRAELALLELVIAFAEAITSERGQHIKLVRIVVFQKSNNAPQIARARVRRILSVGTGMFNA